jgi:hypothetical protein
MRVAGRNWNLKIPLLTHEIGADFAFDYLDGKFFFEMVLPLFALSSQNCFLWSPSMECFGGKIFS